MSIERIQSIARPYGGGLATPSNALIPYVIEQSPRAARGG